MASVTSVASTASVSSIVSLRFTPCRNVDAFHHPTQQTLTCLGDLGGHFKLRSLSNFGPQIRPQNASFYDFWHHKYHISDDGLESLEGRFYVR